MCALVPAEAVWSFSVHSPRLRSTGPTRDVHVLHPAVGNHHGALEEDAAADEEVVVAFGVADGAHLPRNQHQPPERQDAASPQAP